MSILIASHQSPFVRCLSAALNTQVSIQRVNHFADGESDILWSLTHDDISGNELFFTYQYEFSERCTINSQILDALLMVQVLKSFNPKTITGIFPYLGYSRQDKNYQNTQISGLQIITNLFKAAGLDRILVGDVHDIHVLTDLAFPVENISLAALWALNIQEKLLPIYSQDILQDFVLASPDKGSYGRVEAIAHYLDCDYVFLKKKRMGQDVTITYEISADIKDKIVILYDDIFDSGKTAAGAARLFKQHGARFVIGCFTHGVFSDQTFGNIKDFEHIYITDSIINHEKVKNISTITICSSGQFIANTILNPIKNN